MGQKHLQKVHVKMTKNLSKILASVKSDRFNAIFFLMFLNGNRESRLASEDDRNSFSIFFVST